MTPPRCQRRALYLTGSLHQAQGSSPQLASLPAGSRPKAQAQLLVFGSQAFGPTVAGLTSLASVHYPLGS